MNNNTGKNYVCSICGSPEHTKARHGKNQRKTYRGTTENHRCSVCGELGHHANWHRQDEVKNQTERLCKRCNRVLPILLFGKRIKRYRTSGNGKRNGTGLEYVYYGSMCKGCEDERYRLHEDGKIKKLVASVTIEKILVGRVNSALHCSVSLKMECNIDVPYIMNLFQEQGGRCFYSDATLTISGSSSVSIDRIDSKKGYTKGNIVLCTAAINKMKNDYSMEAFIDVCQRVGKYRGSFASPFSEEVGFI